MSCPLVRFRLRDFYYFELLLDDCIRPMTPLHRQLFKMFVEDSAIEDAIYYLGQVVERVCMLLSHRF